MKHVDQRAGIYRVRIVIPPAARHAFADLPKSGDYAVSLGTKEEATALTKAPPIIADIKRRIEQALKPAPMSASARPAIPAAYRPVEIQGAIERWRVATINTAEAEHFNGLAPTFSPFGDEAMALSDLRHKLSDATMWDDIADFEDRMRAALAWQGVDVPAGHPLFDQPAARGWFGRSWANVEHHTDQFRQGVFKHWPEEGPETPSQAPVASATAQPTGETLKGLLERYIGAKRPKGEDDMRYHWRRLVERFGDVAVETITHGDLEAFLLELRRFPKTRKPEIANLPFSEILEKHPEAGPPITEVTVWKHFVSYAQIFAYATAMFDGMRRNPVDVVMPTKPKAEQTVKHYSADDIKRMFAKPMFTGCSKTHSINGKLMGYREERGEIILKDARYWLPILALHHGCRMEELGGIETADVKTEGDISYFDLTERDLKTHTSKRKVPLHPTMVTLGFLDYVADRMKAGDRYLFPELAHDPADALKSTRQYSKWFGLWCDANGFTDPDQNFHSYRHTFKRACRSAGLGEEVHDLLTGHVGSGGVGRGYGAGAELQMLADAIKKVEFPTFKLKVA